jgi:flagellar basal-body rod protein FlgF
MVAPAPGPGGARGGTCMLRSLYSAAAGLLSAGVQEGVVADNLANSGTPGYKARSAELGTYATMGVERVAPFAEMLSQASGGTAALGALASGAVVNVTAVDWAQGPLTGSDNPLAAAIDGPGFFAVATPAGVRYTRGGDFRLNAAGVLTDPRGDPVLDRAGGQITVPGGDTAGTARITSGGAVLDGRGRVAGTVGVFAAAPASLTPVGGGLYAAAAGTPAPGPQAGAVLRPGYVEGSNVDVIGEMASLLAVQQAFASDAQAVRTAGTTMQTAISDVGTVA